MKFSLAPISMLEWDRIISLNPQALLFHTSIWLNLLSEVYGCSWHPLGIWDNGQLIGGFPLQIHKLGPFRLAGSPLMQVIASTPFLGPSVPLEIIPSILPALEEYLSVAHIAHIEIAYPNEVDVSPYLAWGYTAEVCDTVILEIGGRSQANIWNGLSSSCRRAIRKAENGPILIIEPQDGNFIPAYYSLCQEVYRFAGRTPHLGLDFYSVLWNRLSSSGYLKVLLAALDDMIIAGALFLVYKDTVYYLSGASREAALSLRPNNLLQWHFIEWASAHGFQKYDLGGAVVPGITRFKLSFGGSCQSYTRVFRARSTLAQMGRAVYKIAIPSWRCIKR